MRALLAKLDVEGFVFDIDGALPRDAAAIEGATLHALDDHTLDLDMPRAMDLNRVFAALERRRHPRALDAHQVEPARGTVRAPDRRRCGGAAGAGGMSTQTAAPSTDATTAGSIAQRNLVALLTIVRREVMRILRIWGQTLVPPAITMTLYFLIFGGLIGSRVGEMDGIRYMDFIVPGPGDDERDPEQLRQHLARASSAPSSAATSRSCWSARCRTG